MKKTNTCEAEHLALKLKAERQAESIRALESKLKRTDHEKRLLKVALQRVRDLTKDAVIWKIADAAVKSNVTVDGPADSATPQHQKGN